MLSYNEIKPRKFIIFNGDPCEVLDSHVFRKQQRKPVNQTKLKNLITGKVVENSFHQSEQVAEADIEKRPIKYLYTNKGEHWFCEADDPSKRFTVPGDSIASKIIYIKPNDIVDFLSFDDKPISIDIPIKVTLKVTEAPPSIKGNTAQGGNKQVTVETGAVVTTPMFVEVGDTIEINTDTGEYTSRV